MTRERERAEEQAFVNEAIANIDKAIQEMVEQGVVEVSYDEHGRQVIKLTELGRTIEDQSVN